MKTQDELFLLIQSLTKTEKGYFKKFVSRHMTGEKNNYIKLFDAIDKQKKYNEEKIKKSFAGETFIRHLPTIKNYLHKLILKSLRNYYVVNISVDNELKILLHNVEILYEKGLFRQCNKVLTRIKKLAYQHDQFRFILDIIEWEKKIAIITGDAGFKAEKAETALKAAVAEQRELVAKITNIIDYKEMYDTLYLMVREKGKPMNKSEVKQYTAGKNSYLLHDEGNALSFNAKTYYYNTHNLLHHTLGDFGKLYLYAKKHVELLETYFPGPLSVPEKYIDALFNLLLAQSNLRKFDEAKITLSKLRAIPGKLPLIKVRNNEIHIFYRTLVAETDMYIKQGNFNEGVTLAAQIESGLEKYKDGIYKDYESIGAYNMAYLFFGAGDFHKCLHWLNRILNRKDINMRRDIECFSRILSMVAHYELKNYDLVEYICKSTQRYLKKNDMLYGVEKAILEFMGQIAKQPSDVALLPLCKSLLVQLEKLSTDPHEKKALQIFDFSAWLKSKIQKIPFADVIQEKESTRNEATTVRAGEN